MRKSSGPGCPGEKVTDDSSASRRVDVSEDRKEQPEWLVRKLLKQNRRRHSVTLGDKAQIMRQQHQQSIDSTHSLKVHFSKHLCECELRGVNVNHLNVNPSTQKVQIIQCHHRFFSLLPNESFFLNCQFQPQGVTRVLHCYACQFACTFQST